MPTGAVAQAAATEHFGKYLVIVAVVFNAVLCFIGTRFSVDITSNIVIVIEVIILTIGLYGARSRISEPAIRVVAVTVGLTVALRFINSGLDLKILHDLAIMYIFYELGTLASVPQGTRLLGVLMAIVIPLGCFEAFMPTQFGALFDVWNYYVEKGVLAATVTNYANTTEFISGTRGGQLARTFFPSIFGEQRFSSVFLEPVSMGNFAVIAFAWVLSVRTSGRWVTAALIGLAAFCAVLGDSRFAFVCWAMMLALRATPLYRSRFVLFCLPAGAALGLLLAGSLHELPGVVPTIMSDDFPGRLLFSGRLLNYWHWPQWFALAPSQVYTSDTGYAYAINNLGLPLALFLLAVFAAKVPRTPEGASMKAMLTVFMAASLCIGANMFTIKTAALLWFLYGCADSVPQSLGRLARPGQRPVSTTPAHAVG
jgi:putative polymerase